MTPHLVSDHDVAKLDRDLRILIATNGTLTRILEVISNEEIAIDVVDQCIHDEPLSRADPGKVSGGRVLDRKVILRGASSRVPLVAAESLIATDRLPEDVVHGLTESGRSIGEIIVGACLETYRETAQVLRGEVPSWVVHVAGDRSPSEKLARRYRIFTGGRPAISIAEYFLTTAF